MPHFVIRYPGGIDRDTHYQYHRRTTGQRMYEARSTTGPDLGQARVFTTKAAARSAAITSDAEIVNVELQLND